MKNTTLLLLVCLLMACNGFTDQVAVTNQRIEMQTDPFGLDVQSPRFMWQLKTHESDVYQSAYRIVVATSPADLENETNLVWDSGKMTSGSSVMIPYEGKPLVSRETYYWKVKVWTNKGELSWSRPAQWTMALLETSDWKAQWIGLDQSLNKTDKMTGDTRLAARYLRKEFAVPSGVKSARLYITGLGFYESYLNGEKVGLDVFAPTATEYTKQVCYNVYDVTKQVKKGDNTIGVILGNGRYFSMRIQGVTHYGFPKMYMQLEIETEDGGKTILASDDTWKITTDGPILANSEFDGEEYDANKELKGWSNNGYDDSGWRAAEVVDPPGGKLIAQRNPNIRVMDEIKPVQITKTPKGTYMVDMGQNMVGWLSIRANGEKGKPIKMVFAETLQEDGSLYLANLRGAKVTDIYIPSENSIFQWEPRFTYHGFRFVEITGLKEEPKLSDLTGKVIYDRMSTTSTFETSSDVLNQLHKNAYWGIIGNYRSMPTDCPQRDERMGWLGDRGMGCVGESFMLENALLYEKWVQDIEDSQGTDGSIPNVSPAYWDVRSENVTWPAAYIFSINMLYEQYGDIRPILTHYDSMKRWVALVQNQFMEDMIVVKDTYGDWCMPPERQELIHSEDPARKTDGAILSTTFFYRVLELMSKFAVLSGNSTDKQQFDSFAAKMKDAYNEKYFNAQTAEYGNNTVTANMLSLMLRLVPEGYHEKVFGNIVAKTKGEFNSHVSTGLIGIGYLMRGLTQHGDPELAYTIATNKTYPSWGYMIEKGATTIWELWNGDTADPAMNSANHVMLLGDLMIWYYECLAGISSDKKDIGFKKIIMQPYFPEKLDFVKASYESVYGLIRSEWNKSGTAIRWTIEIPANTSAEIVLPAHMKLSGTDRLKTIGTEGNKKKYQLPSGSWNLSIES